jgi:hypothetical protein
MDKNGHKLSAQPLGQLFQKEVQKPLLLDMPKELTILDAQNKMILPITTAIIQPLMNMGGKASDVMLLLESIVVATIGSMVTPGSNADEQIVNAMSKQVLIRLRQTRLQQAAKAKADANASGEQK